jgi:hypothetical protein
VRAGFLTTPALSNALVRLAKAFGAGEVAISRLPSSITPDGDDSCLPAAASIRPNGRGKEKPQCSPSLHRAKPLSPCVSVLSLIENNR